MNVCALRRAPIKQKALADTGNLCGTLRLCSPGVGCGLGRMWPWASGPTGFSTIPLPPHPHLLPPPSSHPSLQTPPLREEALAVCVACLSPGRGAGTPKTQIVLLLPSLLLAQCLTTDPHVGDSLSLAIGLFLPCAPHLGFQNRKCQGPKGVSQVGTEQDLPLC